MKNIFISIIFLSLLSLISSADNGLGKTPPMGWTSWNHFQCNINEELIKKTADRLI